MNDKEETIGFWDVFKSVGMSFLGVQKNSVRERDFRQGRPVHFIAVAACLTAALVVFLFIVVRLILWLAGA